MVRALDERDAYIAANIGHAVNQGELLGTTDSRQLLFELAALIEAPNSYSLLRRSAGTIRIRSPRRRIPTPGDRS
ncbi:TetR family transcriptional regulator C-terminal domain-containing protein [Cryobacterium sp. MP_M3]|uniref:TetR family transcriptional regulator C-terminal domain-containing protein n=1 Tax=Cryobacterium sp. MP_M3 TaxID=2787716 RepID=UPI0035AFE1AE